MKLHFEPDLDYQLAAIGSVADLFRGQEICRGEFTVTTARGDGPQGVLGLVESDLGIGNRLTLLDDEILANLRDVQIRNGLAPSPALTSGDFTVEMETGTGKTYVYLRTLFELNRRYGFTKFVIVVPSVAIKEGVYKTLQITEDHFRALYANMPFDYFLYDSARLGDVRNFATSAQVQVMIVTVGAINKKDVNNLYKDSEKTGGERPIDLIKATRPIVIVDEPQSVDGGLEGRGREALQAMHPLCTLRYSATHVHKHHMVYRLDAVDAYERKLVKQIEVAAATAEEAHNTPYVRLLSVDNKKGWTAVLELDVQRGAAVRREKVTVRPGDDLEQKTGRAVYAHWQVEAMSRRPGEESVELNRLEAPLRIGESVGGIDPDAMARVMIERTIVEHLDKELRLRPQGIKVLSLFFVDRVESYRAHAEDETPAKGKYARIFEAAYREVASRPRYRTLFGEVDLSAEASEVHDGYFSVDRRGGWTDTAENNQAAREAAERAYNLIMKDKEKLLSFDSKLKFIFSHSALREGWDNPNVFQICVLREIGTELARRQTIGRGLRLCVDQRGERVRGFDVNTLTVVASESYEQFAETLQKEMEEAGLRFGILESDAFAHIPVRHEDGQTTPLGAGASETIWKHLRERGYIDARGKVQDALRAALRDGTLLLPEAFAERREPVSAILRKVAGRLDVRNADERRLVRVRRQLLHSPEFEALWERIKHRTTYRVEFDPEKLVRDCAAALAKAPPVARARVQFRKAGLAIGKAGVQATETATAAPVFVEEGPAELPDLLTHLQDATQLTRRSLARILRESGRLRDFVRNPQQFIELATEAINRTRRLALVDGIRYRRVGDGHYYAQELFEQEELTGYLRNLMAGGKSLYEQVIYESGVERGFAEELERNESVRLYMKLPRWFKVPTPLGSYTPDWAVVVERDGRDQLYLVVETKYSLFPDELRDRESARIQCGRAYFDALGDDENPARFVVGSSVDDVLAEVVEGVPA